ncbi:hypothetical protein [Jeotgalibacillus marinus]|uniref:CopG family transcriptional regulator n=1 Tax=Jeotgalibacillus marinus TaxID=86667 RepID=A0ABV3Q189_9BACL
MSVDEKSSIRSILERLSVEGVKTADVAKAIPGISEKPFRNALKAAGYEFSNQTPKGWHFVGEGENPLDKSIFDYVKRSSSPKKQSSPKVHRHVTSSNKEFTEDNVKFTPNSTDVHEQFTQAEVKVIKEMLKSWQEVAPTLQANEQTLYERIKQLPQGNKTRKTIVIDRAIGERLDEFCKAERVNKSDVLHLALKDFLEKF